MSVSQNKNTVEQLFTECIGRRNYTLLPQLVSPQFTHHATPGGPQGPEGFRQVIENFYAAFPDMKITVAQVIGEGDTVATRGYWTGTNNGSFMGMPATGKKVRVEFIDFWRLQDGLCTENWVQMDIAGLMQQLQALPEAATA